MLTDNSVTTTSSTQSISALKLMRAASHSLQESWGEEKQTQWEMLTYIFISLAAQKLKHNKFQTADELLEFLAKGRSIIGAILDHNYSMGWLRSKFPTHEGLTFISNEGKFADSYPELHQQFSRLKVQENNKNDTITLFGKIESDDNKTLPRTKIRLQNGVFIFTHVALENISQGLSLANQAFAQLKADVSLTPMQKVTYIHQIVFSMADTMPLINGSASVAQMIYHALEKCYFNQYSYYFGQMKSAYGLARGYTFDIAAMLAPNFQAFDRYLTENILEPCSITEPSLDTVVSRFNTKEALQTAVDLAYKESVMGFSVALYIFIRVCIPQAYNPIFGMLKMKETFAYTLDALADLVRGLNDTDALNIVLLGYMFEQLEENIKNHDKNMLRNESYTLFSDDAKQSLSGLDLENTSNLTQPLLTCKKLTTILWHAVNESLEIILDKKPHEKSEKNNKI